MILKKKKKTVRFNNLKSKEFFEKISGYDTLRLILCNKAILVEGDSDELVVQRAYMDFHLGKLPIEDNVEIVSVGTSFLRFLEIAEYLTIPVKVVTDNDGNISALEKKYKNYIGKNKKDNIEICYDDNEYTGLLTVGKNKIPFNYNTLEPLLFRENDIEKLNLILSTNFQNEDDLHLHMRANKTDCALKIFSAKENIEYPEYIKKAIL